jgi:hypothetical protein
MGFNMKKISRRRFMKSAIVTGAALTGFPTVFTPKSPAGWAPQTVVHPNVDNLRVVGVTDPAMTSSLEPRASWAQQNKLVNSEAIWENMDKLACSLTDVRDPKEAWQAIFIKPPRKSWSDTVVAIKTNHISQQHTRSAVMAKVCHTLTDTMGVKPGNIHIYDADDGRGMSRETPFAGLPEGCRIEGNWGGINTTTRVHAPWKDSGGESECLKHLVDGSVDILINMAMCKGHSSRFGRFTMTMKNHFGTFDPGPGHWTGSQDYLIAINQTPEILGPMDRRTGKVLYPRQQLCLVDALWASKRGPIGRPSAQPNFIAMGVKFRYEKMGWKPNMKMARRMLTDFGYTEKDLPEGGKLIEV